MRRVARILIVMSMLIGVVGVAGCQNLVESATKAGIEKATGVSTNGDSVTIKKDGKEITVGGTEAGKLPVGFPSDFPRYTRSQSPPASRPRLTARPRSP